MDMAETVPVKKKRKVFIYVVVVLLFLTTVAMTVGKIQNPGDPTVFGFKPIIIESGSMEPTIQTNALVIGKKVPFRELQVGDIITYEMSNGALNTHRIISKVEGLDWAYTKGDSNYNQDMLDVTPENYRYKIIYICNWVSALGTTRGILLFIVLPIFILVFLFGLLPMGIRLLKRLSERRKKQRELLQAQNVFQQETLQFEMQDPAPHQDMHTHQPEAATAAPSPEEQPAPGFAEKHIPGSDEKYIPSLNERLTFDVDQQSISSTHQKPIPGLDEKLVQEENQPAAASHMEELAFLSGESAVFFEAMDLDAFTSVLLSDVPTKEIDAASLPDWRDEVFKGIDLGDIDILQELPFIPGASEEHRPRKKKSRNPAHAQSKPATNLIDGRELFTGWKDEVLPEYSERELMSKAELHQQALGQVFTDRVQQKESRQKAVSGADWNDDLSEFDFTGVDLSSIDLSDIDLKDLEI